jgi:hypothetical protein
MTRRNLPPGWAYDVAHESSRTLTRSVAYAARKPNSRKGRSGSGTFRHNASHVRPAQSDRGCRIPALLCDSVVQFDTAQRSRTSTVSDSRSSNGHQDPAIPQIVSRQMACGTGEDGRLRDAGAASPGAKRTVDSTHLSTRKQVRSDIFTLGLVAHDGAELKRL